MIFDIIRFNQLAKKIEQNDPLINLNLDKFLITQKFSIEFREWYLYPMIASIWSISDAELKKYSIKFIINFFNNHQLTNVFSRPQWKTILGGSTSYVSKIADNIKTKKLNASLKLKKVFSNKVCLEVNGQDEYFDKVIFCNHADEIVNLLNEDFVQEKNILKNIKFKNNEVYIHSDISFMPTRNKCWAAWNYSIGDTQYLSDITYYMNKLQNIDTEKPILITLNPKRKIKESLVYEKINYSHPIIDSVAVRAQNSIQKYQGKKNIFFSGAWLGNGFHEAGISSSLNILKMINNYD
jgi:predicted NAD/FAD-binding protein